MELLDITYCGVCLGQRVADQPGRQQYSAPVDAEGWRRHTQRPVAGGGLIKVRKRSRKVS
jgi:hypothetical protein